VRLQFWVFAHTPTNVVNGLNAYILQHLYAQHASKVAGDVAFAECSKCLAWDIPNFLLIAGSTGPDHQIHRTTLAGVAQNPIHASGPFIIVYHLETMIEIVGVR
jgi:hypothetical protein